MQSVSIQTALAGGSKHSSCLSAQKRINTPAAENILGLLHLSLAQLSGQELHWKTRTLLPQQHIHGPSAAASVRTPRVNPDTLYLK